MRPYVVTILALALGGTARGQMPTPQTPPATTPAFAPSALVPAASPPPQYLVLQLAPAPASAPVPAQAPAALPTATATPQFSPAFAPAQVSVAPQQSIASVATAGVVLLADNPWIVDRILGAIGNWLAKRGQPRITLAPPGSVPAAAAIPITLVTHQAAAVPAMAPVPAFAPPVSPSPQGGYFTAAPVTATTATAPRKSLFGRWLGH